MFNMFSDVLFFFFFFLIGMFSDVLYNQRITNQLKHFHNPPPSPHTPCHYNHLPHPSLCSRHHLLSLHCHHHRLFSSSHHLTAIGQYQHLLPSHSYHRLSPLAPLPQLALPTNFLWVSWF